MTTHVVEYDIRTTYHSSKHAAVRKFSDSPQPTLSVGGKLVHMKKCLADSYFMMKRLCIQMVFKFEILNLKTQTRLVMYYHYP